jgi:Cu/Zn superoxide dismutase
MKKIIIVFSIIGILILSCKSSTSNEKSKTINITFESKSGSKVNGTATFSEKKGSVTLTANFTGLKPGEHAIHIHEKADCSAADATSAGGLLKNTGVGQMPSTTKAIWIIFMPMLMETLPYYLKPMNGA